MRKRFALALLVTAPALTLALGTGPAGARTNQCPDSNQPNELVLAGGDGQTAQLGKPFETNLQVELANTNGCPLSGSYAGVTVDFVAPSQGPSGIFASTGSSSAAVGTNAAGVATAPTFTANDTPGGYLVIARSPVGTVGFYLVNTATGVAASIAVSGAASQDAATNARFTAPLRVRVIDAAGNAVQGATVTFSIGTGSTGASATFVSGQASATTDSDGLATSPPFVANGVPGRYVATASTAGVATVATFNLDNRASATTVTAAGRRSASATVATRYPAPLVARVEDASGRPVEGATVTFSITAAENGAGASFVAGGTQTTALTGSDGRAVSPTLVADKTAGVFTVAASASGSPQLTFTLTNRTAGPYTVTAGAASGTSAAVGTRFNVPLAVTVTDKYGNPVAGARVIFAAPLHGATGRFSVPSRKRGKSAPKLSRTHSSRTASVTTRADGIAVAPPFIVGPVAGGFAVTATVAGTSKSTAFALVGTPR
jgi:protocatechuate 3,4-dioxygenase beta subunit